MSIKLDTFPSKCRIAKAKNYRPISLLLLTSKVIEKSIHDKTRDYLQKINCCTFTNRTLEEIISQIHVRLG